MDPLELDFTLPRRDFLVALTLAVGRETFALVGPSGSGKTSVLRAIAGLERPESGRITLGGDVLFDATSGVDRPVEQRKIGVVFQDYALFPHLSVAQNVGFGAGGGDTDELLARFGIAHLAGSRPARLSGGERQRVALARALAAGPSALLLDEPLAALDAHTRASVRAELHRILRGLAIPVIVVTHDFEDAAVLGDRIGVMSHGMLNQAGEPSELLARPADAFVASFTGANVLRGLASAPGADGLTSVRLTDGSVIASADLLEGAVDVIVHPWDISLGRGDGDGSARNQVVAPITSCVSIGNRTRVHVGPVVAEITTASAAALDVRVGGVITASFKAAATRLVPAAT